MSRKPSTAKRPPHPPAPPANGWWSRLDDRWQVVLLLALTFVVYWPVLHCGFIWDDDFYVTANPTLRDLDGLVRMWTVPSSIPQYYPLVHTTFWIEYHLWNLNPLGYHIVNVFLHGASAVLLWRVLRRLDVSGAWLASALFALHPVMVESVAWIAERKNVLSLVCYLASALAYFNFAPPANGSSPRRWRWYAPAFGLFIAALLSKTVTCSLPAALLLVAWWKTGRIQGKTVWPLIPFFAAGLALGLHTAWLENHLVNAHGPDWDLSFAERCLVAGRVLWFYAGKLLWPAPLIFIYPRWEIHSGVWWQWLYPLAALAAVVGLWSARRKIGRGPLVCALFFAGSLFPASGFVNVYPMKYSFVADHFQYLASIGLLVPVAVLLARRPRVIAGAILVALGVLTLRQVPVYHDVETLWEDTLAKNPDCWIAHNNLGMALGQRGEIEQAERHCNEALRLRPDNVETLNNLSTLRSLEGRYDEAIAYAERALAVEPRFGLAQVSWGVALADQGKFAEALPHYLEGMKLEPGYPDTYLNLAEACAALGRLDEAIRYIRIYLKAQPRSADALNSLGSLLANKGDFPAAEISFHDAIRANPNSAVAHRNLANVLVRQGNRAEAEAEFQIVLKLKPGDTQAAAALRALQSQSQP